jgi:hypothetical protein
VGGIHDSLQRTETSRFAAGVCSVAVVMVSSSETSSSNASSSTSSSSACLPTADGRASCYFSYFLKIILDAIEMKLYFIPKKSSKQKEQVTGKPKLNKKKT